MGPSSTVGGGSVVRGVRVGPTVVVVAGGSVVVVVAAIAASGSSLPLRTHATTTAARARAAMSTTSTTRRGVADDGCRSITNSCTPAKSAPLSGRISRPWGDSGRCGGSGMFTGSHSVLRIGPALPDRVAPGAARYQDVAFWGSSRKGVAGSGPGSLGSPSTRSPRMFRWISSVPP